MIVERVDVSRMLPHGTGWIFVDRIIASEPPKMIRTQTHVDPNDPIVAAHFRNGPAIVPGVILIEVAGQSAYLLGRLSRSEVDTAPPAHLLARCNATFLSPVQPGELITTDVRMVDQVRNVTVYEASLVANQRPVCRLRLFATPAHTGGHGT